MYSKDEPTEVQTKERPGVKSTDETATEETEPTENSSAKKTYALEELKTPLDGVEWSTREAYLSEEDFQKHFGMTLEEFNVMALWKKTAAKKKNGIF